MERALVGNAADPRQLKKAGKIEKERARRRLANLAWIVSTTQGREHIWDALCLAGVFTANQGASEYERGIEEGRRRGGLSLMADLADLDPTLYHRMAREAAGREAEELAPRPTQTEEEQS